MSPTKRFAQLTDLFARGEFFKLVCGAGNENVVEVERLAYIYTLAGCRGFDVSANVQVVEACKKGIDSALSTLALDSDEFRPFITVSVGMPGDHHVRKAFIETQKCVSCNLCIPVCPTDAIPQSLEITTDLCIGCGNCEAVCPPAASAIAYKHNYSELSYILPKCVEAGAESIELHAGVPDDETTLKEWEIVSNSVPDGYISMCLDRYHLTNHHLVERIKLAKSIADDRLIIQADGIPMSGGKDDFNTTLQAISIADIINKELKFKDKHFKRLPILISGGTNSNTGNLARQCNVPFSGITIGTHARKVVKPFISNDHSSSSDCYDEALTNAKSLIQSNLYG